MGAPLDRSATWPYEDGEPGRFSYARADHPTGAACDGRIFFQCVFDQSRLIALDCETGERLWSFQAEGWTAGYDTAAGAAYIHDPKTGGFLSLDTPQSLADKGAYARREGLAGLFAWELTQDDGTLVEAMADAVTAK